MTTRVERFEFGELATSRAKICAAYERDGVVVVRGVVDPRSCSRLLDKVLDLAEKITGIRFASTHRGALVDHLMSHPAEEAALYDEMRTADEIARLSESDGVLAVARSLLGENVERLRKTPLRIDLPGDTAEFAHWHQDHFYVKGDDRTLTLWIPLQDTGYPEGCIGVMPGSHRLGHLPHEMVIGKRHVPADALDHEIRLVRTQIGDVVAMHALLVHSSGLNSSDTIRYSLQARFVPAGARVDTSMGGSVRVR